MNEFLGVENVQKQALLLRAITDPLWFAREIMRYDRITNEFHGPMLREMWNRDLRRPLMRAAIKEQVDAGLLHEIFLETAMQAGPEYVKDTGECWARDHYKTTCKIVQAAKNILIWPGIRIGHWHAVEEKAIECAFELGNHFQKNLELRKIRMDIMPDTRKRKFVTKERGFTIETGDFFAGQYRKQDRHPTFYPKGAGSTVLGGHCDMAYLDDIVDEKTVNDSQMPVIRSWLGNTVGNVVRTDGGWKDATYTPWDEDDVMVDWENSPDWDIRVRACMETEGKADYEGTPVLFDKKWIEKKRRDVNINFPYQMMCDRVPDSERRWPADWKGDCTLEWAMQGVGEIFVLSDPAPMGLSLHGQKDLVRGDTGKDWWSISVWRIRPREDFQDLILLDGAHSQSWPDDYGYDKVCMLMKKWNTRFFFDEDFHGAGYFKPFMRACERNDVWPHLEVSRDKRQLPQYKESYIAKAKNKRSQKLCDSAARGEVWIADTTPKEYVHGDGHFTGFLTQANKWIPKRDGKSNLKWDDDLDVCSRVTDPKLQGFVPVYVKTNIYGVDKALQEGLYPEEETSRVRHVAGV